MTRHHPAQFRHRDRAAAGQLRRPAAGLAGSGHDPADRACLGVRSPPADRRRQGRPDLRRLDAAVGPRRADHPAAPGPAGDQQPHPAARAAGQDRRDRRRRVRRPARLRHRRGLTDRHPLGPARVRRLRPALPRRRLRGRQPRGSVHGDPAAVDRGPSRSTSTAATSTSPGPSATPSPSSGPLRRSSSAGRPPRRCAWSPSTPTCGTSPAATSRPRSAAAPCWTASVPRSAATPPPSPALSSCRSPTTTPAAPGTRSLKPPPPASGISSCRCPPRTRITPPSGSPTRLSISRLTRPAAPAPTTARPVHGRPGRDAGHQPGSCGQQDSAEDGWRGCHPGLGSGNDKLPVTNWPSACQKQVTSQVPDDMLAVTGYSSSPVDSTIRDEAEGRGRSSGCHHGF